jgi:hypothetical protein
MRPFVSWLLPVAAGLAVVGGYGLLIAHATTPGAAGSVVANLPAALRARLGVAANVPVVLVAVHPQCPCLPATLAALADVVGTRSRVAVKLLVQAPRHVPAEWSAAAVDSLRRSWPTGVVVDDPDSEMALALGCRTSGHVVFFTTDDCLRFDGGITESRGHAGPNAAARALATALAGSGQAVGRTAVFGCPLVADSDGHEQCCAAK